MAESTINLSKNLNKIAKKLDKNINHHAGKRLGFTLIIYTEGRASYISNCDRNQSIEQMKHLLTLWGEGMPDIKAHEVM